MAIDSLGAKKTTEDQEEEEKVFQSESELSNHSYNSAAGFQHQNDQDEHLRRYAVRHPLTEVMRETKWHNVPMPVREVFLQICQACIGQDIHTWERKSV